MSSRAGIPSARKEPSSRRVALVTGGAQGIGLATAKNLLENGWHVVIGDIAQASAQAQVEAAGERMTAVRLDVREPRSVEEAINGVVDDLGQIDLLVNNAGVHSHGTIENLAWKAWLSVMDVNLFGVFRCMQVGGRHMLAAGKGAIVNIVSIAAERGAPGRSPYVASKAAVIGLTRTAAVEWATRGVRVNAVGPGYVDTELLGRYVRDGKVNLEPILQRTPLHRVARPEEIASAIRFLASDEASYITGQVLYVDGGFLADYGVSSTAIT
jgi:3-oxoacyl-[acyl-carrier protein] reductase